MLNQVDKWSNCLKYIWLRLRKKMSEKSNNLFILVIVAGIVIGMFFFITKLFGSLKCFLPYAENNKSYTICFFVFICVCIICITVICVFTLKYVVKICKLEKLKLLDEKTLNCIVSCDGAKKDAKPINISFGNNSKEIFKAYANAITEL